MKLKKDKKGQYSPGSIIYINAIMIRHNLDNVNEAIEFIEKEEEQNENQSKAQVSAE